MNSLNQPSDIRKYSMVFNEIGSLIIKKEIPDIMKLHNEVFEDFLSFLTDIVIRAQEESSLPKKADPESTAIFLIAAIHGLERMASSNNKKLDFNAVVNNFIDTFFRK